jgi:hypothetical protein
MAETIEDVLGWSMPFADDFLPADIFARLFDAGALRATEGGWTSR